jgi:hypothetical protein
LQGCLEAMRIRGQEAKLAPGYDGLRSRTVAGKHALTKVARIGGPRFASPAPVAISPFPDTGGWFAGHIDGARLQSAGFRLSFGGTHLSRTMMLAELRHVLGAEVQPTRERLKTLVLEDNVLQKRTGSGRRLSLRHLRELYGLGAPPPILQAMIGLWPRAAEGQPMLALLVALAREALLRDSAEIVLPAPAGSRVRAADFASLFEKRYPGHYTPKMFGKISRNCASTWTQSGHLRGKVRKERARPAVSPAAAAYAALLGSLVGFGGPALLASPWIAVLDRSEAELLVLLRKAEAEGLLRLRAGGDVIEIEVRRHMAATLEIPELADH